MKAYFYRVIFAVLSIILLSGCNNEEKLYTASSDEIVYNYIQTNGEYLKRGTIVEVTGVVQNIFLPKDGIKMNESSLYLGTKDSDIKFLTGNFISCKFNSRKDKNLIGKHVKIRGKFNKCYKRNNGITIALDKCEIIDIEIIIND